MPEHIYQGNNIFLWQVTSNKMFVQNMTSRLVLIRNITILKLSYLFFFKKPELS